MDFFNKIDIHTFALILCIVMLCADRTLSERHIIQNRLFRGLLILTTAIIVVDMLGVYSDGQPELRVFSLIIETLLFIGTPLPAAIWALYVSYQMFQNIRRLRIEMIVMTVVLLPSAVLSILNLWNGFMFRLSDQNVYTRGPLFFVIWITSFLPIAYSIAACLIGRKKVSRRLLIPMLLFPVPPVLASLMQVLFYGISVIWASITVSIFIIYISIQVRQYNIDHLTGVYNRRQLDSHLDNRIQIAKRGKPFSCMMLDIDSLKAINDQYGHLAGDEVLCDAAKLLRSCIRSEDFLSRYAGDEFVIILDSADPSVLGQTAQRIHTRTTEYNQSSGKPFRLDFSIGYEVYDEKDISSKDHFISRIDALMYQHKKQKKEIAQILHVTQ